MSPVAAIAEFRLYRSGWTGDALPWADNQLWGSSKFLLTPGSLSVILQPEYGSAAALYRLRLEPADCPEDGWVSYRCALDINNENMGDLPLTWYVGTPADWPSGLVRYPERHGPYLPANTGRGSFGTEGPRGVWTVAARRDR